MGARASEVPRIRVAALALIDGRVVTVRHAAGGAPYHLLPGGGVRRGETLAEALTREVAEETGLSVEVGDPLLLSDTISPDGRRHVVNLTFRAEVTGGAVTERPDDPRVEAVDLVDPKDLAALDFRPPIAAEIVEALAAGADFRAAYLGARFTPEAGHGRREGADPGA